MIESDNRLPHWPQAVREATMHRWGIIGTGDISHRLVSDLRDVAAQPVTAVWGRSEERARAFAATHGVSFWSESIEEVYGREDVDIVYIATPADTHLAFALAALNSGKHVLVEKPIASSAADAEQIFEAARSAGLFAMEAMWMRFNPLHVEVIDRIGDGLLGDVNSVRASFGTPFQARGNKLTAVQGGSILRDRGIYPITLAQWFLGAPASIDATGAVHDGVDVNGHATLEFDRGFAHLAWSGIEFLDLSATISGELGWITLEPMFWAGSKARVHAGTAERIFSSPEVVEHPRRGNGYGPMLLAVEQALDDGLLEHPWHDRDATLQVARTMDDVLVRIESKGSPA
jgi:predicted dehydrogenase